MRRTTVLLLSFLAVMPVFAPNVRAEQAERRTQEAHGPIKGPATVTDGDGLEIAGEQIRLYGIDAPETQQYCKRANKTRWHCGQYSTVELDKLVTGKEVTCDIRTLDRYGRWVAVCKIGEVDLGRRMVEQGWAVAYRRYAKDYVADEDIARKAKRGVWAGEFEMPWDWRAGTRGR